MSESPIRGTRGNARQNPSPAGWQEADTETFLGLARYAVPDREAQIAALVAHIPTIDQPFDIIDLCCGEGLLSAAMLARYRQAWVTGLDGSAAMLASATKRCRRFGVRFTTQRVNLGREWAQPTRQPRAVVSSLAIHHLDDHGKQTLFREVFRTLAPGGALLIADLIQPATVEAQTYAADDWDEAVRERALLLDGNTAGFDSFVAEGWNLFRHPDPEVDKPATLFDQLSWLREAGFVAVDVSWMRAGHAIFGGRKP